MRTQTFQTVFNRIVRKLGRDPLAEINEDMARAIVESVNERVETIYQAWDWPEWTLTEERAYRQIWSATRQFSRTNTPDGKPDEVFYLGTSPPPTTGGVQFGTDYGYYRVKSTASSDPPVGTVPTNTIYWESMEQPVDAYIDYDQVCRRSIGRVLGVYSSNPRLNGCGCHGGLKFKPSEKGIDVCSQGTPTVFVTYLMPRPVYSIIPYADGKSYLRGDTIFYPPSKECFQANSDTAAAPTQPNWNWVPFLDKWATYVVQGAYADCMDEFDQGGNDDIQAKQVLAQKAQAKADAAFEARVNELTAQGQVLKYSFCRNRCDSWCESIPFSGGSVTTLTDACESGIGWVFPAPPSVSPTIGLIYYPNVDTLKTTGVTLVGTVPTIGLAVGTMAVIKTGQHFRLDAGAANPLDPGQGQPGDYNLASNNKCWVETL